VDNEAEVTGEIFAEHAKDISCLTIGKPTTSPARQLRAGRQVLLARTCSRRHRTASLGLGPCRIGRFPSPEQPAKVKITAIGDYQPGGFPTSMGSACTDEGIVGGRAFYAVRPVIASPDHRTVSPRQRTADDRQAQPPLSLLLPRLPKASGPKCGPDRPVDIALWDILQPVTNQPHLPTSGRCDPR
jgi:hypothetical protein